MDVVYSFGRSVDVDGDEWIDLGPPPAPCEAARPGAMQDDDENNKSFAVVGTSKVQDNELTKPRESSEPLSEPEPEQVMDKAARLQTPPTKVQKKTTIDSTSPQKPKVSAPTPLSKAVKSKEALVAFYLGRAKRMEARHKQIAASPPKPTRIPALQERSRPIGL